MSRLKIGAKIGALVAFLLVMMGVVGLTSVLFLRSIANELHEVTAEDLRLTEKITQISLHELEQEVLFERALRLGERLAKHGGEKARFDKVVKAYAAIAKKADREFVEAAQIARQAIREANTTTARREFVGVLKKLKALEKRHKKYERHAVHIMALLGRGAYREAEALIDQAEAKEDALVKDIEALVRELAGFTKASVAAAEADERRALIAVLVLSLVALLAGIVMSTLVIRGITRPLRATVGALGALATGSTGVHVEVKTRDEMKDIADAFEILRVATIEAQRNSVILRQRTKALSKANKSLKSEASERRAAQIALQASEQRFKDFANTTSDWFWEMDERLRMSYFSDHTTQITGIDTDTMVGKSVREIGFREAGKQAWRTQLALLEARKPFRDFIFSYKHPNGRVVHLSTSGDPIFGPRGRFLGYRGTGKDVTGRVRAQEELRSEKESALRMNRAKSEFLANMSHELRTPLNAIIGFAEMMQLETFGPLGNQHYNTYAGDIQESGHLLLSLINDILDLSKIEAGKHELFEETVDAADIVTGCMRVVKVRASEAGLRVRNDAAKDLPKIRCDERALKQIILNLLTNAVKFTPGPGQIFIETKMRADGWFALSVADTGIGIAAKDIDKVLQPFTQVDGSLSRKYEGSGLGLPLVKSLVELHGGKIEIESSVGKGTTVSILLPPDRIIAAKSGGKSRAA